MNRYQNRIDAGKILAQHLKAYKNSKDAIVLALPRGGVPVAYEIATSLNLPLDVFIVRKLGVPGHSELAMGAIAMGGGQVFNQEIIHDLHISQTAIEQVIAEENIELKRRAQVYRGNRVFPVLRDKIIILVDDGIATGATMRAAIKSLRELSPKKIVVAVPVADRKLSEKLAPLADEFVCPMLPETLNAVGSWYENFDQTEDEEVHRLLNR